MAKSLAVNMIGPSVTCVVRMAGPASAARSNRLTTRFARDASGSTEAATPYQRMRSRRVHAIVWTGR